MTVSRRRFLAASGSVTAALGFGLPAFGELSDSGVPPDRRLPGGWEEIRRHFFDLSPDSVYMNNSTLGATLRPVTRRMAEVQRVFSEGCNLDRWVAEIITGIRPVREAMVRVSNAPEGGRTIGNVDSVTEGMSFVAGGLTFFPGDVIVTTDHEHTGGRTMWELQADRYGAHVVAVPLLAEGDREATWAKQLLARFEAVLRSGNARCVSFPWITTSTGHVLPARELCALAHRYGAVSVVDAAQAFAVLPLDLAEMDCDFLAVNGHKYLCGPVGSGFLCVHPRQLEPVSSFWGTVVDENCYNPPEPSRHFPQRKGGIAAYTNLLPLQEALAFYETLGPERVAGRLHAIGNWLRNGLGAYPCRIELVTPRNPGDSCVMTCFRVKPPGPGSAEVVERLKTDFGIHVKHSTEGGADAVRLAPHYYNTVREFLHLARAICSIARVDTRAFFSSAPPEVL